MSLWMSCRPWAKFGSVVLVLLLWGARAEAQVLSSPTEVISRGTAYYMFTAPGQQTHRIIVLGAVAPGIYEIGEGTTLSELVALVRGNPTGEVSDQVSREVTVQLYREEGGQRSVIYDADYDDFLRRPAAHPALQDGDVLVVEVVSKQRTRLRDILQITSSLASLTLLVIRLSGFF